MEKSPEGVKQSDFFFFFAFLKSHLEFSCPRLDRKLNGAGGALGRGSAHGFLSRTTSWDHGEMDVFLIFTELFHA